MERALESEPARRWACLENSARPARGVGIDTSALRYLEDELIKDQTCLLNRVGAKASGEHALRLPPVSRGVAYRSGACFGSKIKGVRVSPPRPLLAA